VGAFYEEFGRRVREAREKAGLTQKAVAERLRITRSSVANIEAGRHRILIHQAVDLADALGVSVDELLPTRLPLIDDELRDLPTARALREISDRWTTFVPRTTG
jgi:transcriptional regulator with XRE-family HTH domain